MEEDIKILEELLSIKTIDHKIVFTDELLEVLKKTIRNILTENKELRKSRVIIDNYIDIKKFKQLDEVSIEGKQYIAKDKIREKIEKLENSGITINYGNRKAGKTFCQAVNENTIKNLQELLED